MSCSLPLAFASYFEPLFQDELIKSSGKTQRYGTLTRAPTNQSGLTERYNPRKVPASGLLETNAQTKR